MSRTGTTHRAAPFRCSRARRSRSTGRHSRGSPISRYTVHVAGGGVQVGTVTIAAGRPELVRDGRPRVDLQRDGGSVRGDRRGADHRSGLQRGRLRVHRGTESFHHGRRAPARRWSGSVAGSSWCCRSRGLGGSARARSSLQGFAGGATAGLGGAVLLQQFCTLPLTPASAAGIPVVVGTVGAVGASLARRAGARGARRVARLGAGHGGSGAPGGLGRRTDRGHRARGHEPAGAGYGAAGPSASAGGGLGAGGGGVAGGGGGDGPSPTGGGPGPAPTAPIPPPPPPPPGGAIVPPIPPPKPNDEVTCSNCGAANSADSRFCTNCGTRLGS